MQTVLARVLLQRPAEITPGAAPESPAAMRGWGPAFSLRRRRRRLAKSLGGHGLRSFEKESYLPRYLPAKLQPGTYQAQKTSLFSEFWKPPDTGKP